MLFSSPEIVSTSTVSGCQPFCPIPNFVCQGRHIKNSSATRFNADHQIISRPVLEQPNLYARKIITHFNHLFVPRKGEGKPLNFPFCFVNPNLNSMSVFGFKVVEDFGIETYTCTGVLLPHIRVHLKAESAFSNMYVISSVAFSLPGHR